MFNRQNWNLLYVQIIEQVVLDVLLKKITYIASIATNIVIFFYLQPFFAFHYWGKSDSCFSYGLYTRRLQNGSGKTVWELKLDYLNKKTKKTNNDSFQNLPTAEKIYFWQGFSSPYSILLVKIQHGPTYMTKAKIITSCHRLYTDLW